MLLPPIEGRVQTIETIKTNKGHIKLLYMITDEGQLLPVKVMPSRFAFIDDLRPGDAIEVKVWLNTRMIQSAEGKKYPNLHLNLKFINKAS